jgi:hypothetical protein
VDGLKKCFACEAVLPFSDFYKHPRTADGYLGKCKSCQRESIRRNRLVNLERFREYDRERAQNPARKVASYKITQKWRTADPRRMRCHNAVARAIKSGRLQKQPCEYCGAVRAYAHHDSYDEPLNVIWLCQPCHKQRHKELDELNLGENCP